MLHLEPRVHLHVGSTTHTCDHLCDGVLHLEPRVHLHEEEVEVLVHDELHCARAHVVHGSGRSHRRLTYSKGTVSQAVTQV